ncbi:MAG: glycosyltransferase [Gammaproteobacteria bacterium]|nr:glycosyltransferase [Gammaproteobacteria bacterium]
MVFLKAMGVRAAALLRRLRDKDVPAIFDANVNYYELGGEEYYRDMLPTERQKRQAIEMTEQASAVVADSQYISGQCAPYNANVKWIPDNVRLDLVPPYQPYDYSTGRLRLLWSGQVAKLFELLHIESELRRYAHDIELVLVTNPLKGLERIRPDVRLRLTDLLESLDVRIVDYRDPLQLLQVYSEGGVSISPRFLDSPYNLGHTEWKISLAMACGRVVICSPVPSYSTVQERAGGVGIRVVDSPVGWASIFDQILTGGFDFATEERGAREVIRKYYSTDVVAGQYSEFLESVVGSTR